MRLLLPILLTVAYLAPLRAASAVEFPYEAIVESDEAYVRSGSSKKYYPTGKLRRGDRVTVQRHDPGGWFMITPPAGSFSWVPARYVQKVSADRGVITTNNVAVRVGSFESDIREVYQRKLSQDDEIRILGEKMLTPETGVGSAELWYRIEPPRGEWRWISGQEVAAAGGDTRAPADDPFESPAKAPRLSRSPPVPRADDGDPTTDPNSAESHNREYVPGESKSAGRGLGSRPLIRKSTGPAKPSEAERNQQSILNELDRLDARFRSILDKPRLEWDFDQLEKDYQALREETGATNIRQMIDTRLDRIAEYRKTRSEEEDVERLRGETLRRDAELAELQRRQEAVLLSLRQPKYDGAGIVQRSALSGRGSPRYALLNQSGRVLAYLAPAPGVNLEGWVGRPAGVVGPRIPNAALKADLITVNQIVPVRLTP
jgi:hypothetical protein